MVPSIPCYTTIRGMAPEKLYASIGQTYISTRRLDPRIAAAIRLAIGDARTLPETERRTVIPGVRSARHSPNLDRARMLIGVGPPGRPPILQSEIAAAIVRQYLLLKDGLIPGDVNVPYFDDPQERPGMPIVFGWEQGPDGKIVGSVPRPEAIK